MKIAATKLVQLLVCETLPFAKMLFGKIRDPLGPDRCRRFVGAAQMLVTQTESCGNRSASLVNLAASEQSHENPSWP
jgi:hypothetical protein